MMALVLYRDYSFVKAALRTLWVPWRILDEPVSGVSVCLPAVYLNQICDLSHVMSNYPDCSCNPRPNCSAGSRRNASRSTSRNPQRPGSRPNSREYLQETVKVPLPGFRQRMSGGKRAQGRDGA